MKKKIPNINKLTNTQLLDDHRLVHAHWSTMQTTGKPIVGGRNKEDLFNIHQMLLDEMKKRGFAHHISDKTLDKITLPGGTKLSELPDLILAEGFISLVGSTVEGRDAQDTDVLIRQKSRSLSTEKRLTPFISNPHFIYDEVAGGQAIPLYDLALVRRRNIHLEEPEYSFPLFSAAPPQLSKNRIFLHRQGDFSILLDEFGEEIDAEIPPELRILKPDPAIIELSETFEPTDIWRWFSTELVKPSLSKEDRAFFLDKAGLELSLEEKPASSIKPLTPFQPLKAASCKATKKHFEEVIAHDPEQLELLKHGFLVSDIEDYHNAAEMLAYDEIEDLKTKGMFEVEKRLKSDIHLLLRTMYWEQNMTLWQIAEQLLGNRSKHVTIWWWMKRLKIPTRSITSPTAGKALAASHRNKISAANKGKAKSLEHRKHLSEHFKKHPASYWKGKNRPLTGHMLEGLEVGRGWNKGLPVSSETRKRLKLTGFSKGHKPWNKDLTKETDSRVMKVSIGKKKYKFTDTHVKNLAKALQMSPNSKEIMLGEIISGISKDYKFVGDGQVVIGGKMPDFININGQKKIVEFFGKYWHENDRIDNGQSRIDHFKPFGFDTLIVWEEELEQLEPLQKKLERFL